MPEELEVEDDHARQERIGTLLERLAQASSGGSPPLPFPLPPARDDPDAGDTSELLARVRAFLPTLAASNAELSARAAADPRSVDIENVKKGAAHVRMDLGLGVFEERRPKTSGDDEDMALEDTDSETSDSSDPASSLNEASDDELDSEQDSDSSSEYEEPSLLSLLAARPTKPLPKRVQPSIEVLSSSMHDPPGDNATRS